MVEPPCQFRTPAFAGLVAAGLPWRVVFTSPSLAGLWAAARAELGFSTRTDVGLPTALRVVRAGDASLPPCPGSVCCCLGPGPNRTRLSRRDDCVRETLLDTLTGVAEAVTTRPMAAG